MKINLQKIENFYKTEIGRYSSTQMRNILSKILKDCVFEKSVGICASGCFEYIDLLKVKIERLALQSYNPNSYYPSKGKGSYVVCERNHWPYRAEDADFVVLVHDVEFAENPELYLNEAWRVLKGEGRLIMAFPNRTGKWAKYDNTSFGWGYPYTVDQMTSLLNKARFEIDVCEGALFYHPYDPKTKLGRLYRCFIDKFGSLLFLQPGVIVVVASKHVYAPTKGLKVSAADTAKKILFPAPNTATNQRLDNKSRG